MGRSPVRSKSREGLPKNTQLDNKVKTSGNGEKPGLDLLREKGTQNSGDSKLTKRKGEAGELLGGDTSNDPINDMLKQHHTEQMQMRGRGRTRGRSSADSPRRSRSEDAHKRQDTSGRANFVNAMERALSPNRTGDFSNSPEKTQVTERATSRDREQVTERVTSRSSTRDSSIASTRDSSRSSTRDSSIASTRDSSIASSNREALNTQARKQDTSRPSEDAIAADRAAFERRKALSESKEARKGDISKSPSTAEGLDLAGTEPRINSSRDIEGERSFRALNPAMTSEQNTEVEKIFENRRAGGDDTSRSSSPQGDRNMLHKEPPDGQQKPGMRDRFMAKVKKEWEATKENVEKNKKDLGIAAVAVVGGGLGAVANKMEMDGAGINDGAGAPGGGGPGGSGNDFSKFMQDREQANREAEAARKGTERTSPSE